MNLKRSRWRRFGRWIGLTLVVLLLLASTGFVAWATIIPAPMAEAQKALMTDAQIEVTQEGWLAFMPRDTTPTVGYLLYPGGRVPAAAYAPLEGYLVVIVYAPLNLALFNVNAALPVIEAYPAIETWVTGGHSLGGVAASALAQANPQTIDGLVLMASVTLSPIPPDSDLPVLSIYGTLDGLQTPERIAESQAALPAATVYVAIEGGNHAQFGWYGAQAGDLPATISHEAQEAQVVAATLDFLAQFTR
jgi:pimeloyl-ACP methyl ester carboxylesterase